MRYEHKELIHDYLNLEGKISSIKQRMARSQLEFESQSFSGGTRFSTYDGVRYVGFKIADRVSSHIDLMNTYKRNIAMNERRLRYFDRFLRELDPHTVFSLMRRYERATHFEEIQELGHDRIVLEEILEIEEAVSYEFNTELSDELERKAIKVEYALFSEKTVEDSFQTMQSLLGV